MRILMLSDRIPPENVGGAEKVAWTLAQGLRDAGHEVHVAAATDSTPFEETREGIPTYHLYAAYRPRWQAYLSLYNPQVNNALQQLYEHVQPDVVSAFNIHRDLTYHSLTLAHQRRVATVLNSQDVMAFTYDKLQHFIDPTRCDVPPTAYRLPHFYNLKLMRSRYNPLRNMRIHHVLTHHTDSCVAGSETHRQTLVANGLPFDRVVRASVNPADFAASETAVDALRQQLDLQGRRVILFAGRLSPLKGGAQLLQALERVVHQVPEALLLVLTRASLASQGFDRPELAHLLPYVRAGGWMQGETLAAAYRAATVAVVPSICMDTFPTVNLEAMAAARPVIATCYGGSAEAVIDSKTGYIVNPYDIDALADRIMRVLREPDHADQLGQAGYRRLRDHFTPARHAQEMETVYAEAIEKRQRRD